MKQLALTCLVLIAVASHAFASSSDQMIVCSAVCANINGKGDILSLRLLRTHGLPGYLNQTWAKLVVQCPATYSLVQAADASGDTGIAADAIHNCNH